MIFGNCVYFDSSPARLPKRRRRSPLLRRLKLSTLIPTEQVAGVDFVLYIIQTAVVAVGDDGLAALFENVQIVHHFAAEEGSAILQSRLIDDNCRALGLDTLHDALNGRLTEVIGVGLHGQAVDADDTGLLVRRVILVLFPVAVVARHLEHPVCNEIFAGAVGLHDGLDEIFRHILVVGEELLGIFRQAVAAVTKAGIIIMCANAGVEADALDDMPGIKPLHLGVGVQFVEEGNAEGQIGVGEQLDRLGLGEAHEEGVDILFDSTFL